MGHEGMVALEEARMNATAGREEYVAKFKKQIDAWNADMVRWEGKAKEAKVEMQERLKRELEVLNAQRELARYNLRLLEGASAGAWAELRQGADDAWDRMRLAAEAASTYFGELPATRPPKAKAKAK
jgi:hypothetical protein